LAHDDTKVSTNLRANGDADPYPNLEIPQFFSSASFFPTFPRATDCLNEAHKDNSELVEYFEHMSIPFELDF
jgi:hypothetical protein